MLLRRLEYFVAVAREEHFSYAAYTCGVSQPALSDGISKLEQDLGVPLIRRSRQVQGLTAEGAALLPRARRLLEDRRALYEQAHTLRAGLGGRLRVGAVPGAVTTIAPYLDRFVRDRPAVHVDVTTALESTEIIDRVHAFEFEVGVIYPAGLDTAGLHVDELYRERPVLLTGPGLEVRGPVDWSAVAALPLGLLHPGMRGRAAVDAAAVAAGEHLAPRIEADALATLLALVAEGGWATVLPDAVLTATTLPAHVQVHTIDQDGPAATPVALVRVDSDPPPVLVTAFADTITDRRH